MRFTTETPHDIPTTTTQAISRWALPAALLLALTTMGSAHGTQAPADHAAEFDPGSVCASSPTVSPSVHQSTRIDALVIGAHAASLHTAQ
jgi:hypothetical protein